MKSQMNERDRKREEEMQGWGRGKYHWKLNKVMQLTFSSIHFVFKSLSLSLSLSLWSCDEMKKRSLQSILFRSRSKNEKLCLF